MEVHGDLVFRPESRMACINVSIINDGIRGEPVECFNVLAEPGDRRVMVRLPFTTVCIIDGMYHVHCYTYRSVLAFRC